jgi:hypothetical protein
MSGVLALSVVGLLQPNRRSLTHFKAAIEQLLPRLVRRERVPFVPFLAG